MPVCPIPYRIAPKVPKLRGTRGNLKPVVANEEEVIRALRQPAEVSTRNGVPTENASQYLGWEESRHVQQRVPGAFELDYDPLVSLVFFDLLFQREYGIEVDLPIHCCS